MPETREHGIKEHSEQAWRFLDRRCFLILFGVTVRITIVSLEVNATQREPSLQFRLPGGLRQYYRWRGANMVVMRFKPVTKGSGPVE